MMRGDGDTIGTPALIAGMWCCRNNPLSACTKTQMTKAAVRTERRPGVGSSASCSEVREPKSWVGDLIWPKELCCSLNSSAWHSAVCSSVAGMKNERSQIGSGQACLVALPALGPCGVAVRWLSRLDILRLVRVVVLKTISGR